jgi:hypothetical protein
MLKDCRCFDGLDDVSLYLQQSIMYLCSDVLSSPVTPRGSS